jgi:hypothetical protein
VAPPRLMPGLGFVDTAMRYKESVYSPGGIGDATQLAAMPSVHVAWAVFIAVAVIAVSSSRWRWLIIVHPAATIFAVVATANHWWLDGIVAAALLPVSVAVYALVGPALRKIVRASPAVVPVPSYGPAPLSADDAPFEQRLRDLDRVERRALAEVVTGDEQREPPSRRIAVVGSHPPDQAGVAPR